MICSELPFLADEQAAYDYIERKVWPMGPVCPHCGDSQRIGRLNGQSTRIGSYKCYVCRRPFTVKLGTVLEGSHLSLHKWLQALFFMEGRRDPAMVTAAEISQALGVDYKTASHVMAVIADATGRPATHAGLRHLETPARAPLLHNQVTNTQARSLDGLPKIRKGAVTGRTARPAGTRALS